jgi:hypothetical protein
MLSKNEDAHRLREQTFVLSDFLAQVDYRFPALKRKALVRGHCHQKAAFDIDSETTLLSRMGIKAELLDSGYLLSKKNGGGGTRETEDRLAH